MNTYRELEVWQVGMTLVEKVYAATKSFPPDERFGLTSQLRRAAVSIPTNVAEGACRRTTPAYINHVSIALGSHGEIETCIEVSLRLGYLSVNVKDDVMVVCDSEGRLLNGLMHSLESKLQSQ
ncbi:MAG: four helix bundle protein [Acidobacteria bacterium]|nr:four helix bundle protein [Acidobacteriota bacterium]